MRTRSARSLLVVASLGLAAFAPLRPPSYSIDAIRYATVPQFPLSRLVMGAPETEKTDIAMVVWLIRGGGADRAHPLRHGRQGRTGSTSTAVAEAGYSTLAMPSHSASGQATGNATAGAGRTAR